ncbi:MAG TPA: ATP-grasp domain-containing protein [Minicystis sp.]|nr:ATP-grasp domain-containing protein [Minicystis sp.]
MENETHVAPMSPSGEKTILCLASYFKGNDFLAECKEQGYHVVLLTLESLLGKPWARDKIDEVFALSSFADRRHIINSVAYLARARDFSRIAPLDDYDVETVAHLREFFRIPGIGETTARHVRDKLAMRQRAADRGIAIPEFVHVLNDARIAAFLKDVPAPWLIKPRAEASAVGIKRFDRAEDVWPVVEQLGDKRSDYLIERMVPGDVYHVDAIVSEREVVFAEVHRYRKPLLDVTTTGGIFMSSTVPRGSEIEGRVLATFKDVVRHLGLVRGVMHTEFIVGRDDGRVYFLETAARVGGAHIADLVHASTGINLWREWAKIELSQGEAPYALPARRRDYGGLVVCLARQEHPDTSGYDDPEVVWRLSGTPPHHVGLVVRSADHGRIQQLLDAYEPRIQQDFLATLPAPASPTA